MLYEEPLDEFVTKSALRAIQRADTLIISGTSLTVYPAAGMIYYFGGRNLVLINRDSTPADSSADLVIHGKAGEVFSKINA